MKLKQKTKRRLLFFGLMLLLLLGATYYFIFRGNISIPANNEKEYLYIPTGATFDDVLAILRRKSLLKDETSFTLLCKSVGYTHSVLPGKYRLSNRMTNFELVRLLKSGKQEPVKLIIKGSQSMLAFLDYVSNNLEITHDELNQKLTDDDYLMSYSLNKATAICLIVPNTYEMYWNTPVELFLEKMHVAYEKFWMEKRTTLAKESGLTKTEVVTLASIIEKETDKDSDLPMIAGVYINRLSKGMKLQADPTVLYAMNNMISKRVYSKMLDFDSPYNTYRYSGLPPGPICIPAVQSVDAVLNYQKHHFIYFCARADGSGYSDFAEKYDDHKVNAKKYRNYLDEHNIK
ncbi:MAG: endolytic transglycosylase MltG [Bacteroidetes bacterium]|nr:endolytic transglycosylase MltG [Bacteroidota bacterium]